MNDYPGYWLGKRNANLIKSLIETYYRDFNLIKSLLETYYRDSLQFTMEYQGFEIIGFSHQKFETVKWCFRALGI